MALDKNFKDVLRKVFAKIKSDPTLITHLPPWYLGATDLSRTYTIENLENLTCNHLFDDNPVVYGITELEGSTIRHFFSVGADTYDFVLELRKEFPDFFNGEESKEYLDCVNERRKTAGLEPICL